MKQSIRTKIFIPVFVMLVLFPIAALVIFWQTSLWYVRFSAENDVAAIIRYVDHEVSRVPEFYMEGDGSDQEAKEAARELMTKIRKQFGKKSDGVRLMVFNSRFMEIYPDNPRTGIFVDAESRYWQKALREGTPVSGEVFYAELPEGTCAAQLYAVDTDHHVKTKYFLAYEPVLDVSQMISRTGGLVAAMAAVLLALSGLMVRRISRSIIRPVEILCRKTAEIGTGESGLREETFSVRELEQLRTAFCAMEERLIQAQEEKQQIFQNISHDLRTPLASIMGYAEGIRRGVGGDPSRSAEIILKESRRMNRMVDSILTLSRLDSHAWKVSLVELPLDEFLDEQTDILQGLAGRKELLFREDAGGRPPVVKSDPELLARIFQNVVSNCLRYAENRVTVSLSADGDQAVITVEDDGPGLTERDREHLFERYYKGEKGEFGLGLSLVWSGMQYLGGRVEADGKQPPEHGTVFRLFLSVAA